MNELSHPHNDPEPRTYFNGTQTSPLAVLSFPQKPDLGDGGSIPYTTPFPTLPTGNEKILSPLSARLGMPIYYSVQELLPNPASKVIEQPEVTDTPTNQILHYLSMKKTPHTPKRFSSVQFTGLPRPTLLLVRADGKKLHCGHVTAMYCFIHSVMQKVMEEKNVEEAYGMFDLEMTTEKFGAFFEEYRGGLKVDEVHEGKHDYLLWEKLECPVVVGCKACGESEGGFSRCGKCGVVRYCGKECQRRDWGGHKEVCIEK